MKVAIIGAGNSGLLSLKNGIDEGLDVVCYEMTEYVGGLWSPHKPEYGLSTAYEQLITNSTKEMMAFSDLPFPASYPSYMTRDMFYKYILSYCEKFKLYDKIKLRHKVHSVTKTDDHERTGCWNVTVEDLTGNKGPVTTRFDGVIVCSGIHGFPYIPNFPGMDKFKGKIVHAHSYTSQKDYSPDEKVLVVGNTSSGLDMATDLAKISNSPVYVSGRSGVVVLNRKYAAPGEMVWSLFLAAIFWILPKSLSEKFEVYLMKKISLDVQSYGFPKFEAGGVGAINDDILSCLQNGTVKHVTGISEFKERGVVLSDGTELEIDTVLMGTGYEIKVPVVTKEIVDPDRWNLYKLVWPTHLTKNTLALVGFVRINGSGPPVSELQARWVVTVFSGKVKLPQAEVMKANTPIFVKSEKKRLARNIHVNVVPYCAEIACYIGCHPRSIFFRSPYKFFKSYFGSAFPYIYRLVGPGKSDEAWHNVVTAKSRIHPFKHILD